MMEDRCSCGASRSWSVDVGGKDVGDLGGPDERSEVAGVEAEHVEGVGGSKSVGFGDHAVLHRQRQNAILCGADVGTR